jgi:hypothetical protein
MPDKKKDTKIDQGPHNIRAFCFLKHFETGIIMDKFSKWE